MDYKREVKDFHLTLVSTKVRRVALMSQMNQLKMSTLTKMNPMMIKRYTKNTNQLSITT